MGLRHRKTAQQLQQMVDSARERTLALVADLSDDQLSVPRLAVVNPFRWELGHIAFFYDAMVLGQLGRTRFLLPSAETLYDSFEVDHDDRWSLPLPSRTETLAYMEQVREAVLEEIGSKTPDAWTTYIVTLAVFHEDMHDEAFTYMRQTLEYKAPVVEDAFPEPARLRGGALSGDAAVPGGVHMLGATEEHGFVFDNEKWAHPVEVAPFRIARAATTNAEFAQFVDDDGYHRSDLWSPSGWVWRTKTGAEHPLYWHRTDGAWARQHFDRVVDLEPDAPACHVSWYEAEAYCTWAGRRLPTEVEWDMAASAEPTPDGRAVTGRKRRYPWGDRPPAPLQANLGGRANQLADVAAFPDGDSAFGCRQMIGNVWEWTADAFYPFPGYVVDRPYREYSAPWFGYRKVLKGGCWATTARMINNSYRNFFTPDRRDVYAGFRTCAR